VELLLALAETGEPPKRVAHVKHIVPEGFSDAYAAYMEELSARGLRQSTRQGYLSRLPAGFIFGARLCMKTGQLRFCSEKENL
jgi:hypothetical protein